jgi:hypothetical protein
MEQAPKSLSTLTGEPWRSLRQRKKSGILKSMSQSRKCILTMFLGLALLSCSGPKTIPRDELRSDLLTAISLTSETELFINQLQERRVTLAFAEGHMKYLGKEASRLADKLRQAIADDRITGALESGRAQLDSLAMMLADLKIKPVKRKACPPAGNGQRESG